MSQSDTFLWTARLLRYPDAELATLAQECGAEGEMPAPCALAADTETTPPWASAFLRHVATTPLLELQEDFVRTFDLNPSASLYLTTHVYGDSPLQGRALAALLELYREGGCEPGSGELPDYLPMALEFLAVAPPWAAACLCEKFSPVTKNIATHLTTAQSPWADMLHATADAMQACVPDTDAHDSAGHANAPAAVTAPTAPTVSFDHIHPKARLAPVAKKPHGAPDVSDNSSREVCI